MDNIFIQRRLFAKIQGEMRETQITIAKPFSSREGSFECAIVFLNIKKYNTIAKGFDEFNAIECALDYVQSICSNSEDPEFFINESESMKDFYY